MKSKLISFRLPVEIYDNLVEEKQPGESDGALCVRVLSESLGYIPKDGSEIQFTTKLEIEWLVQQEVGHQTSNLRALLTDLCNQLNELKVKCKSLCAKSRYPRKKTSSDKKLAPNSSKNP